MSTVTSRTKISIDELVEGTIISGRIDSPSGQLILTTRGGAEILAGHVSGGGGVPSRQTSSVVTTSVPANSYVITSITLAKSYKLLALITSAACRVRLYATAAGATSDALRPVSTDPADGFGCMLDYVTTHGGTYALSPQVDGSNMETTPTSTITMTVDNQTGTTASFDVSFIFQAMES